MHCHGGDGGEFGPDAAGAARAAAAPPPCGVHLGRRLPRLGAGRPRLSRGVPRARRRSSAGGELAGIHLEGPFLSSVRCGAQDPAALVDVDLDLVEAVAAAAPGAFAHMTFAPERAGADALAGALAAAGALGSVGHTDADYATHRGRPRAPSPRPGCGEACPLVTHLFNGMPPMHHRSPGPVAASLAAAGRGEAVVELIADGVHLDGGTVRMVMDTVGPAHVALVSDAMAAAGLPEGAYTLGGRAVTVRGREARLAGGGSIAGGVSTLLEQVRWCVRDLGVALHDAVTAASRTPATALALTDVGQLSAGRWADVLVVDDDLELRGVLRSGAWATPLT